MIPDTFPLRDSLMPSLKLYLPGVPQSTERSPSETVTVALPTRTRTTRRRIPSRSRMAGRRISGYPVDPLETRRELRWKLDWTVGRRNSWFVPSRVSLSLFSSLRRLLFFVLTASSSPSPFSLTIRPPPCPFLPFPSLSDPSSSTTHPLPTQQRFPPSHLPPSSDSTPSSASQLPNTSLPPKNAVDPVGGSTTREQGMTMSFGGRG